MCYFPKEWKHVVAIPFPKPGKDPSNPSNYCPISLLSSISKVFERIILKRSRRSSKSSIWFLGGMAYSTSHQLNRVVRHVKYKKGPGQFTGMLYLDVEKAFDSVWHDALLHKLIQGLFLARIIHYFLSERTFQVSFGKSKSSVCNIPYGVPQGAVLSPTLYNLCTSDAPTVNGCELTTFADDTVIFVSNAEPMNVCDGLQSQLNSLTDYYKQWKRKVSASRTQANHFTRWSLRCFPSTRIVLNSQEMPWSWKLKYLRVTLGKRLTGI
jgi:hypothetical protein